MRILLMNDYQRLGGVEIVVDRTAQILRDAGHEVRILTGDQCVRAQTPWGYIASSRSKRALRRVLREFEPDAIHIHNLYHLLSPAVLGVCEQFRRSHRTRIILTVHDHHLICPNPGGCVWRQGQRAPAAMPVTTGLIGMLRKRWDHRSWFHSTLRVLQRYWNYTLAQRHLIPDVILSPAPALAELVSRLGHPDVRVVLNPLAEPITVSRVESADHLRVAVAGRIDPEKGVAELIRNWPRDLRATIQIAGQGTDLARCKQFYESRKSTPDMLTVEFLGHLPHQESMQVIARADLLIVPSIGPEVAPLVLDEALILGTQILVSNQPALRTVVERAGRGWVFNPQDPTDLSTQLRDIEYHRFASTLLSNTQPHTLFDRSPESYLDELLAAYTGSVHADPNSIPR